MTASFDPVRTARFIAEAHATRSPYRNLPPDLAPANVADAYASQEALRELWAPERGPVAGLKIATTTKVMQQLMGIDHPCGGIIYANRVHGLPATIRCSDFVHVMVECELAVRLGADLPAINGGQTRETVRAAVAEVMPAFELIEDRNAVYKETNALSLIADNAWNGGIVLGPPGAAVAGTLDGVGGRLVVNGVERGTGKTDDPMGALAWVANLAIERGRPMTAGMVIITGSVIVTIPMAPGDRFAFTLDGLGTVEMTAV